MSSLRAVAGAFGAAIVLTAWSGWMEQAVLPAGADGIDRGSTPAVSGWRTVTAGRHESEAGGRLIDMYGNEVERAVGDYRIDYRGDIYERHSPQTAVPKLPPPIG